MTPEEEAAHFRLLDEVQDMVETKNDAQLKLIRDFIRKLRKE